MQEKGNSGGSHEYIQLLSMTDDDVLPYVQERLPAFVATGAPERLPEGNLNFVWRVQGRERSIIVKHAPPYIAVDPDTPLDPSRLTVEARCLQALSSDERLTTVGGSDVRTPHPLDVNSDAHVLIMEDLGDLPPLDRWLRMQASGSETASALGEKLGTFIGHLHATTGEDEAYAERFDNRPMQETRHAVQYRGVSEMLVRGGISDAEALGERAERLGEELLQPGACLTMGDLWPRSVLVDDGALRLIDWELAHYGRPLQDVAHAIAHLWMQKHRAPGASVAAAVGALRTAFLEAYRRALGDKEDVLWTEKEKRDAAIHFGAEILVRAVGPFQDGYVYDGLDPEAPAVQEAVEVAASCLRHPEQKDLLTT
jgi:5-methylthioribose kinase